MPKSISEQKQLKWKDLIERQRASGHPIRRWCLENEVNPHTFSYWKSKLFPKSLQKSSFIELKSKSTEAITLKARGLCIRLGSNCDPQLRKQLLSFIGELAC